MTLPTAFRFFALRHFVADAARCVSLVSRAWSALVIAARSAGWLVAAGVFFISSSAYPYASQPLRMQKSHLILSDELNYFWTTENYDLNGNSSRLTSGNEYKNWHNTLAAQYTFGARWAVVGSASLSYAQSYTADVLGTTSERDNSQFTDLSLGVRYKLPVAHWLLLYPEIDGFFALNSVDAQTDDVVTGEGASGVQAGSWIMLRRVWRLYFYSYLGARYRMDGRSTFGIVQGHVRARLPDHWFVGGTLADTFTIINDDDVNQRFVRTAVTDRVDGGSFRYYAVNPETLEGRLWAGLSTRRFSVLVGYGQTFAGHSSAAGSTLYTNIAFDWDFTPAPINPDSSFQIQTD